MGSRRPTKPILTQGLQALSLTNPWIWLPVQGAAWQVPFNKRTRPNRLVGPSSPAQMCQSFASFARDSGKPRKITHPSACGFPSGFGGLAGAGSSGCVLSGRIDPTKTVLAGTIAKAVARCLHRAIQRLFSGPSRSMAGLARLFCRLNGSSGAGGNAVWLFEIGRDGSECGRVSTHQSHLPAHVE